VQFSQDIFDAICDRIGNGESLRSICRDPNMPSMSNVFRWLSASAEAADQYVRARETQADTLVDEIIEIADDRSLDANDRRVRIDARKWVAGKMRPKVYGERLAVGGDDDAPPVRHAITWAFVKPDDAGPGS
jgi:hypothetical protein